MSLSNRVQRPVDHLVLPVIDLTTARLRLSELGFSVAPDARHPFGTENACVYFADTTYLEPIAIADRQIYDAKALAGYEFVRRDRAFRFRIGQNGLSAVVFKSNDAAADLEAFSHAGLSAGELFSFSRPFTRADGSEAIAGFRLAFAADLRSPDLFFFTCERLEPLSPPDTLLAHQNGVTGLSQILIGEDNPMDFEPQFQALCQAKDIDIHPHGITIDAKTARISVFSHDYLEQKYGLARIDSQRGLQARAVVFSVDALANIGDILEKNAVVHDKGADYITVPPAPGQGVTFIFRED